MAKRHLDPMHDEHVNVTPLIDVVMCLIIFFLVVGRLVKDEMVDMVIPKAHLGQEMEDQMGRLTINVVPILKDKDGNDIPVAQRPPPLIKIKGTLFTCTGGTYLAEDRVTTPTTKLRKEKSDNPDLKVILRADENEKYDWIAPVLVACAQANIKNVNFSTKRDDVK